MKADDLKLKVQALVDNELPESEIPEIMKEIEGSYELRGEYVELLQLRKRLEGRAMNAPSPEWFEGAISRTRRRAVSWTGNLLFLGSYLLLIVYALVTLLRGTQVDLWVKIGSLGIGLGFLVLLIRAISDRIRESRNDRYKGVMK